MNSASTRPRRHWLGVVALSVASGAAGWALKQPGHDSRVPAPAAIADARVANVTRPSISRVPDAAIRSTVPDVAYQAAIDSAVVDIESSCEPADEDVGVVDATLLERTVAEGTESERQAALTRALQAGIDLPRELLRVTYGSDPSESVRLLAFTTYVDAVSDNRVEVRAALESGAYNDSPAVQAEAQRRLAELDSYERALAETPPQAAMNRM
jgi:hypothetical protein